MACEGCLRPHRPFDFDGPPVWRLGGRWLFRGRLAAAVSPDGAGDSREAMCSRTSHVGWHARLSQRWGFVRIAERGGKARELIAAAIALKRDLGASRVGPTGFEGCLRDARPTRFCSAAPPLPYSVNRLTLRPWTMARIRMPSATTSYRTT